jgi:glycosyltransferase involved in cell wall biosynthesis
MTQKQTILHICNDYPDVIRSANKTEAVLNLVEHSKSFDHVVLSLNRSANLLTRTMITNGRVYAVNYWGLPLGIGLRYGLERTAKEIETRLEKDAVFFDLVHAHKLTMEGIVGYHISQHFQKPMICTVRGQTDLEIIRYKPTYRSFYGKILNHCKWLFFVAPWTKTSLNAVFPGADFHNTGMLPNIVYYVSPDQRPEPQHSDRFITAVRFDAKNYKSKNLDTTIRAFDRACRKHPELHLDIAGDGTSSNRDRIEKLLESVSCADRVHFIGELKNEKFCAMLPEYAAFVRPSYPETFGMVYLESLFAGLPVLYAEETGIDGYFEDAEFAVAVDHHSADGVAGAMMKLYEDQAALKQRLSEWLDAGSLKSFLTENIIDTYARTINHVLKEN